MRCTASLVCAVSIAFAAVASANDLYVDVNYASCATGTGGAADPFCNIGAALAVAAAGDTIHVAPGSYVETLDIKLDVTLIGTGGELVTFVDGAQAGTVVLVRSGVTAAIEGLTLTNGRNLTTGGGGVTSRNATTLLTNTTVCLNSSGGGGGIYSYRGTVTLTNSTVSANTSYGCGGGIYSHQTDLTLTNSTVAGNSAYTGGGLYVYAYDVRAVLTNSTLDGNTALYGSGGGLYAYAYKGDIAIDGSTISLNMAPAGNGAGLHFYGYRGSFALSNSTVGYNDAPAGKAGGVYTGTYRGSASLSQVTVSANTAAMSGGVYHYGGTPVAAISAGGSIVAGNAATIDPDVTGNFSTLGFNVIGIGGSTSFVHGLLGDQVGTYAFPLDPMLGPLLDNGGPTFTRALLSGSPAIDAGDPASTLASDQRGVTRPQGGQVDVGAFEAGPVPQFVPFGAGLAGTGGLVPALAGAGVPTPGAAIFLDTSNAVGGAVGILGIGFELVPPVPLQGGSLHVFPQVSFVSVLVGSPGVAGAGSTSFPFGLPDDMSLVGLALACQAGYLDPGAVRGVSLTNGLRVIFG